MPGREVAGWRPGRTRRGCRGGFTLIELLTVVAIIGILATLLLTAVTSARKASWQARCASNLRQISLALNMYLDDLEKRPPDLAALVESKYLPDRGVLLCPADKTRNWGRLVHPSAILSPPLVGLPMRTSEETAAEPIPYSYLDPLDWEDSAWSQLMQAGSSAGLVACQLHGLGRPNLEAPSISDFQGLLLRAQRDGAVVRRKVFWNALSERASNGASFADASFPAKQATVGLAWELFSDGLPQ